MTDILDWVGLSLRPGIGAITFWKLVEHFGDATRALRAPNTHLHAIPGVSKKHLRTEHSASYYRKQGELELQKLEKMGGKAVVFEDSAYPELLRHICDPPPVIYILGRKEVLNTPLLAIVGSRAATAYGSRVAFSLARDFVENEYSVVSGLALGIDRAAHLGALSIDGKTAAVLGCGLDIVYPKQNYKIFQEICKKGVLVTEYPLGTRPDGFRFPARNRIIAGMCQGVVVVEAAKSSGSLITAQLALDEGREIFAVPGQVDSCKSVGAHWLLQQGATLVQNAQDVLTVLNPLRTEEQRKKQKNSQLVKNLDPDARLLLQYIDSYPSARDGLTEKTGLPIWRVSELLLLMELEGLIEMLPGDQLRRIEELVIE